MPYVKPLPVSGFYAVIFSPEKGDDLTGNQEMDEHKWTLASQQPGYPGYEPVDNGSRGIFISYWESLEAISSLRAYATHKLAKAQAHKWYKRYFSQVCRVESNRLFDATV